MPVIFFDRLNFIRMLIENLFIYEARESESDCCALRAECLYVM